jgi:hypothetical protein
VLQCSLVTGHRAACTCPGHQPSVHRATPQNSEIVRKVHS